jgi:sodium pump decarboxylase gamma subunit
MGVGSEMYRWSIIGLGFGTVFVGLICLIFITKLMGMITSSISSKKALPESAPARAAVPAEAASDEIADRGAFVAAVSCAIAETMGKDVKGLRIHSIKKI